MGHFGGAASVWLLLSEPPCVLLRLGKNDASWSGVIYILCPYHVHHTKLITFQHQCVLCAIHRSQRSNVNHTYVLALFTVWCEIHYWTLLGGAH